MHSTLCRVAVLLAAVLLLAGAASAQPIDSSPPPAGGGAENDFFMATWLYNAHKWAMAADEYGKFLKNYPQHRHAADAQFGQAQAWFQLGKYKEAADGFKELLDKYKNFDKAAEAHFQLGQAYLGAGQLELAAAAFADTAGKYKEHHLAEWADAKRAECLINLRQYAQAEPLLLPLVSKYLRDQGAAGRLAARKKALAAIDPQLPASFETLVQWSEWNLGLAQFGQKKYAEAAQSFGSYLDRNPEGDLTESARLYRGQSLYFLGKYPAATAAYDEVIKGKGPLAGTASFERALAIYKGGDLKKAAEAFIASARDFPDTERAGKARLYAGTCLFEAADYDGAVNQFEAMISSKNPVAVDEAKYWKGMAQLKLNRPADAMATFTEAIKAHPGSARLPEMRLGQASAAKALNRFEDAANAYQAFAASFPQNAAAPDALYNAAFSLHQGEQYLDSAKLCAKFLADYPKDKLAAHVVFIAAENQFLMRNYPQAAQFYRQLLDKHAAEAGANVDRARLRLAWTCYLQKQYDQGLPVLAAVSDNADNPVKRESAYLRAVCLYELKRDDEAAKALTAYLAAGGDLPYADDALFRLADIRKRQDHPDLAVDPLEQLIKDHPNSVLRPQAEYQLAGCLQSVKRPGDALTHYQEVVKRDAKGPLAPYAAFGIGLCYYDQGKWKEAADAFAGVVQNYPNQDKLLPQALYRQALCFQRLEQWAVAERAFNDLIGRYPKDPYAGSALKAVGLGLQKQDKFDKAVATFDRLIKDYPQAKDMDQAYYELAWCYHKLGNKEQMLAAYKALAAKFPESPLIADAYYYLGEDYYGRKEYSQALEQFQASLSAAKDERLKDKALYRIGWCQLWLGRSLDAAKEFDRLVKDYPASDLALDSLLNSADAYLQAGKSGEAADRLTKLIDHPAAKGYPHLAEASLRLGEAQLAMGQPDQAMATFKSVREKFPQSELLPMVDFGTGRALFELKKYPEAVEVLRTGLEKMKGETAAKAQFYIGESHLANGKPYDAIGAYLRVTVLYVAFPEWVAAAHFELGQAYLQVNQKADAIQSFQTVATQFPQSKWAGEAKKQLAKIKP